VEIATNGRSEAAKVAAANSILDRGHGRPYQRVEPPPEMDQEDRFIREPIEDILAWFENRKKVRAMVLGQSPPET
jgi:hypothetical protein